MKKVHEARERCNHNGQKIGSKGERTRRLLIEATVKMLEEHGLRDVSVMEVARKAGTSPATFYVYFRSVPEVVLAALEDAVQFTPKIAGILDGDWLSDGAAARARAFVEAYTELWNRNRTIFRVRNLAAEEGDERFLTARLRAAAPTIELLTKLVERGQSAGRTPKTISPAACASTILMMLERLSAIGPLDWHDREGLDYANLKEAAAYTISYMLGARN